MHLDSRCRLEIDHGGACSPGGAKDGPGRVDPLDRMHGVVVLQGVEPVHSVRVRGGQAGERKLPLSIANTFRFRFGQRHRYGLIARLDDRHDDDAILEIPRPRSLENWEQVAQKYPSQDAFQWSRRQDRDQTEQRKEVGGQKSYRYGQCRYFRGSPKSLQNGTFAQLWTSTAINTVPGASRRSSDRRMASEKQGVPRFATRSQCWRPLSLHAEVLMFTVWNVG